MNKINEKNLKNSIFIVCVFNSFFVILSFITLNFTWLYLIIIPTISITGLFLYALKTNTRIEIN